MMDMDEINDGHYLELMDRLHVVSCMVNDHLLNHPLTKYYPEIQSKIETALDFLSEAYQDVGNEDSNR